jgi:hypothetical protein
LLEVLHLVNRALHGRRIPRVTRCRDICYVAGVHGIGRVFAFADAHEVRVQGHHTVGVFPILVLRLTFIVLGCGAYEAARRDEFVLLVLFVEGGIYHVEAVEVRRIPIRILCQHLINAILLRKMFDPITGEINLNLMCNLLEISRWSLDGITFAEGGWLEGMEDVGRDDPALSVLLRLLQPITSRLEATTVEPLLCNVHRSVPRPERMLVQALSQYLLRLLDRYTQPHDQISEIYLLIFNRFSSCLSTCIIHWATLW